MSGHSKWSQIKRLKEKTDGQKSKTFSKYARLITAESKKTGGKETPGLLTIIENAKKDNVPKDVIERAVKKGSEAGGEALEMITYETYGPGGCAIVIDAFTSNRNKAAAEIKHILTKNSHALAAPGSATWAFRRDNMKWIPQTTTLLSDDDLALLDKLVTELDDNDEVQEVFTNVE